MGRPVGTWSAAKKARRYENVDARSVVLEERRLGQGNENIHLSTLKNFYSRFTALLLKVVSIIYS